MNKKYIDFVPANKDGRGKVPVTQRRSVSPAMRSGATMAETRRGATGAVVRSRVVDAAVRSGTTAPVMRVTSQRTSVKRVPGRGVAVNSVATRRVTTMGGNGVGRNVKQTEIYTELPAMQNDLMAIDTEMDTFSLNSGATEFGVIEDVPARFVNTAVDKRPLSDGPVAQSSANYNGYASYGTQGYEAGYSMNGGSTMQNNFDYSDYGSYGGQNDFGGQGFEPLDNDSAVAAKEAKSKKIGKKSGKVLKKSTKKNSGIKAEAGANAVGGGHAMTQTGAKAASGGRVMAQTGAKGNNTYNVPKSPFINQGSVAKRPLSKNVYQKKVQPTKEGNQGPVAIISRPEKDSKAGVVVGIILTIILGAAAGTIAFLLLPK